MTEKLTVMKKDGRAEKLRYYSELMSGASEFDCAMFAVGIEQGDSEAKIYDFSPDEKEADELVLYLYENNVTPQNLFCAAEKFVLSR